MDDAPVEVKAYVRLVGEMRAALEQESIAGLARATGLDRGTIHGVLSGKTWWNLRDLAKVEAELNRGLWSAPDRSGD